MIVKTVRDIYSLSVFIDGDSLFSLLSMAYAVITKGATNLPRLFTPTSSMYGATCPFDLRRAKTI